MKWPADLNWEMTLLFLLALALLGFVMKLIALLMPATTRTERPFLFWLLPSPNSLKRSLPAVNIRRVLLRPALLFGAVALSYWIYWQLVRVFHVRGVLLSYAAIPILLLVTELLVALATVLWLPSGRLLPALHCRPVFARSVADFWSNRWNLWFRDWFRYAIFARLRRRPVPALFLVFVVSGLMHEWVINVPLYFVTGRAIFGTMMLYFLLQAAGIVLERRLLKRHSCLMAIFVWLVVFVPAPLVVNEGLLRTLHLWPEKAASMQTPGIPDDVNVGNTSEVLSRSGGVHQDKVAGGIARRDRSSTDDIADDLAAARQQPGVVQRIAGTEGEDGLHIENGSRVVVPRVDARHRARPGRPGCRSFQRVRCRFRGC